MGVVLSGCKLRTRIVVPIHVKTEGSQFQLGVMRHPFFHWVFSVKFFVLGLTDLKIRPPMCVRLERI
jgi:hypothetical protein